ncbi:M23 family metallopeptidase [Paenibacillus sp. GYB003]|uniref:M23 family metallopeptidase n=1 Tax=Paenibacillus sp. GYB003 TaxID=2994392 RepID=UPI002F964107
MSSAVTNKAKALAKNYAKKQIRKLLIKLGKKALIAIGKGIALVGKMLLAVAGAFGLKGFLILLIIVFVGGALMYVFPFFGWFSSKSGSPKTPDQLRAEYEAAIMNSSEYAEYRPPQMLVQFIDNQRILKEKKKLWEIDPNKLISSLKPDIEMETFTDHYYTRTVTRTYVEGENEPREEVSESSWDVDKQLITKAHAWNRIETFTYRQEFSSSSSGDDTSESTVWVLDNRISETDFSKFDNTLKRLKFTHQDFKLLVDTVRVNKANYLDGYEGIYGSITGGDDWWGDHPSTGSGNWIWPTISTRITSGFYKRVDPFTGQIDFHNGLDIGRPIVDGKMDDRPQPIFAVADGEVTVAGEVSGYGNAVYIRHDSGVTTVYGHLKSIESGISVRKQIKAGTVIGIMGSTGRSTGIHLHFGVLKDGQYDNPLKYISLPSGR